MCVQRKIYIIICSYCRHEINTGKTAVQWENPDLKYLRKRKNIGLEILQRASLRKVPRKEIDIERIKAGRKAGEGLQARI